MGIDQIAVMGHGIGLAAMTNHKGLGIGQDAAARSRVADMTDGAGTGQVFKLTHVEHIGHQPHGAVLGEDTILDSRDAGTFLPPVLQGV